MNLTRYRTRDLLRSIAGLLFASGAVALEIRKSATWGLGGRMLVVLIPGVLLYGLALEAAWRRKPGPRVDAESWQSVFAVFAVFLNAIWLTLLFRWVGAHGALITIPALGLTAASAAYAAWRANVRFAALLAALGIVVAWLALWNKLLHPPADTNRWLLLIVGVGLVAAAVSLARRGRREANELVTAAGAAGVLAASAGVFVDLLGFSVNRVVRAVGLAHSVGGLNVKQHFVWDLLLLLMAVGLIAYGSRARVRGPGYVGAAGLFVFLFSVGGQISARLAGRPASGTVTGWPLALLVIGAILLLAGFVVPRVAGARSAAPPPEGNPPRTT
jgi:hypothetical protein